MFSSVRILEFCEKPNRPYSGYGARVAVEYTKRYWLSMTLYRDFNMHCVVGSDTSPFIRLGDQQRYPKLQPRSGPPCLLLRKCDPGRNDLAGRASRVALRIEDPRERR